MKRILNAIHDAESPTELWRTVRGYYRGLGFGGLAYFVANRGTMGSRRGFNIIHRGFPKEISRLYIDERLGEVDPGPPFALSKGVPLRWSVMWRMFETEASAEELAFLARMRGAQLGDGYHLPVFGPSARNGCITVGTVASEQALDDAPVDEMHLVAQAAHMRLCQILPDRPLEKPLSARELEILDWVARGKSNSVIADILSLSGATVDTYLRRIYDKLDVSDRTSAAVRGVGMGLIAA